MRLLCISVIWWRFKSFSVRTTLTFGTKLGHFVKIVSIVSLWSLNLLLVCVFLSSTQSPPVFCPLNVFTPDISDWTPRTFMFFLLFVLLCFSSSVITTALMICGLWSVYRTLYPVHQPWPQQLVFFFNWRSALCGGDAAFFSPHMQAAYGGTVWHWCWINPDWPDCVTIIKLGEATNRPDEILHNFSSFLSSHLVGLSLNFPSLSPKPSAHQISLPRFPAFPIFHLHVSFTLFFHPRYLVWFIASCWKGWRFNNSAPPHQKPVHKEEGEWGGGGGEEEV